MNIDNLIRKNIRSLQPYSCARDEFKGEASVYLDANENPYNAPFNRYPDPLQLSLKVRLAALKQVLAEQIFLGNGSDEAIDLLYRAFCNPGIDNVVAIEPTYGMYKVSAAINDVEYRPVLLDEYFQITSEKLLNASDEHTKLIWLCSPNNPTGNSLDQNEIVNILNIFNGLVVLDEAYIDFSAQSGFVSQLKQYPNLVILQTFSKAWGSAGIRLGMAFASVEIIMVMNKIKYPYNINILTQQQALKMLDQPEQVKIWVQILLEQRSLLINELNQLPFVRHIFLSDANFVLVKVDDANAIYHYLVEKSIIVRNRNNVSLCLGCLRITVGTPHENTVLLSSLREF